ncbi:MAG: hypothetical protein JNL01_03585, partial [Bdellovibrionales bacterium]|nr:hypothetical protein [Bdellovibrionales bacterium]
GPLGKLGSERGVCQGMAGITGAFFEMGRFDPSQPKPTAKQSQEIVDRLIRRHSGGCSTQELIPGYANLREFCAAHTEIFLKRSISYNASIAAVEILPTLPQFLTLKSKPVTSGSLRRQLDRTVQSLSTKLREGRIPLVMVYSHVTNVLSLTETLTPTGKNVKLITYDSNDFSKTRSLTIRYGNDGLPTADNRMIWDVTPDRRWVSCR